MQAYQENISAKVSGVLSPILGVSVTVTDTATGLPATLYSDNGVTQIAQPLVTDETGYFGFYAANGSYTVKFSSPQIAVGTRKIELYDRDDDAPLTQAQAASPTGASSIGYGPRTVANKLDDIISVKDFGAKGDGTTDDTAAFRSAAATGRSFHAIGTFNLSGTIPIAGSGQRILGEGPGLTTFVCSGSADIFSFTGGVSGQGIENVKIDGVAMTGGNLISVIGVNRLLFKNLVVVDPFNFAYIKTVNVCSFKDVWVNNIRGAYGFQWYGDDANRSDVLSLTDVSMSGNPAARPHGIIWDGNCHTLRMHAVAMVNGGRGLWTKTTTGSNTPQFMYAHGLEIDFPSLEAVRLDSGAHFNITGLYAHGSLGADGVYVANSVDTVAINQAKITSHWLHGINANGARLKVTDCAIRTNGQAAANTYDGVYVGATSVGTTIVGGNVGDPQHKYGVEFASGARRITLVGSDLTGNTTGGWIDNSGGGNSNVLVVSCGDPTGIVNNVQFSTNGSQPTISPTGASADIDLAVTGKGNGRARLQKASMPLETTVSPTVNGDMVFQLTSNTSLAIKVRGSDGVVRSTTLTLV